MEITLKNQKVSLTVTTLGGTMRSLQYEGVERLWQGDEFWKSQDVCIFPIIGHADAFQVGGKDYEMKSHGVVRYADLTVLEQRADYVKMGLTSNEQTLAVYPYAFRFAISYQLLADGIQVTYHVASQGGKIPFYVGGHPGMQAPKGVGTLSFEQTEYPVCYAVGSEKTECWQSTNAIELNKKLFAECKTLQLGNLSGGELYLDTVDGYRYTYQSSCPVWAFWSNEKGGEYLCVEPWWGINDYPQAPREFTLKPFMQWAGEEEQQYFYTLKISKQ